MSTSMTVRGSEYETNSMTVLSESQLSIPVSGKIRPGIQVLTPTAAKNPKAVETYNRGVKKGVDYGRIGRQIQKELDLKRSPLMPKNVQYFTVRSGDFINPKNAEKILELYGEDRGDGKRLYRFPVVFPVDAWQAVLPHALKCYTRRELKYWSQYTPEGVRMCMTHAPIPTTGEGQNKRAIRTFGGRPVIPRTDFDGRCDPERCPEYQNRQCNLSGKVIFYIPGVTGAGAIEIPMKSFYALNGMRKELNLMLAATGRISGTKPNGEPMFYLTKREEEVSMIDDQGEVSRKAQWLTVLEANMDVTAMLSAPDEDDDLDETVSVLEGPGETIDQEVLTLDELKTMVRDKVQGLGIAVKDFTPYAIETFGADWGENEETLSRIIDELDSVDDVDAYIDAVAEGGSF